LGRISPWEVSRLRRRIALPRRMQTIEARALAANEADESIKKAVGDAATVFSALWVLYLYVLCSLGIAVGTVADPALFFERPIKLSFLTINSDVPLLTFFFLAPLLFLIVHAFTLGYLVILTDKAKRLHQGHENKTRDPRLHGAETDGAGLRGQLPSNIFMEFPARPTEIPGIAGWLSNVRLGNARNCAGSFAVIGDCAAPPPITHAN
jgi:hypothetical protein